MAPGISSAKRADVIARDGPRCWYCRATLKPHKITLDHVIPRARGGPNTRRNLVVSCLPCNLRKGCLTGIEYLSVMKDDARRKALQREITQRENLYGRLDSRGLVIRPEIRRHPAYVEPEILRPGRPSRLTFTLALPPPED